MLEFAFNQYIAGTGVRPVPAFIESRRHVLPLKVLVAAGTRLL